LLIRLSERCRTCRYEYNVYAWYREPHILARCANATCDASRGNLDHAIHGAAFGILGESGSGRANRFVQTNAQKAITRKVADGACVHCRLHAAGVTRKGAVSIPAGWRSARPTIQLSLLRGVVETAPTRDFTEISAGTHGDHIIHVRLHDRIEADLSGEQSVCARKHWVVPSCPMHNQARSSSLEPLPYLLHLFAFFVEARSLRIGDVLAETYLFTDAARIAHAHLLSEERAVRAQERDSTS